jgi:hypothetical protein
MAAGGNCALDWRAAGGLNLAWEELNHDHSTFDVGGSCGLRVGIPPSRGAGVSWLSAMRGAGGGAKSPYALSAEQGTPGSGEVH